MRTSQYTPGPWRFVPEKLYQGQHVAGRAPHVFAGTKEIATVYGGEADARLIAVAPRLFRTLAALNHMGGDERGGYCICPRHDGSAPDEQHASSCADARAVLAAVDGAK